MSHDAAEITVGTGVVDEPVVPAHEAGEEVSIDAKKLWHVLSWKAAVELLLCMEHRRLPRHPSRKTATRTIVTAKVK